MNNSFKKVILVIGMIGVILITGIETKKETERDQLIQMIEDAGGRISDIDEEDVTFELGTKLVTCKWFYVDNYLENGEND